MCVGDSRGGVGGTSHGCALTRPSILYQYESVQFSECGNTRPQAPQDLSTQGAPECVLCRALRGRRTRKPHLPHQEGPWRENNKQPRPRRPAALLFIGTKCGHRSLGRRETPGKL